VDFRGGAWRSGVTVGLAPMLQPKSQQTEIGVNANGLLLGRIRSGTDDLDLD
jgi:hypothetical protein